MPRLTEREQEARRRLCVALDGVDALNSIYAACELDSIAGFFKIGKALHIEACNDRIDIVNRIYRASGKRENIFLDLKLHDKPEQIYHASKNCVVPGLAMFTVHISGGEAMCKKAIDGACDGARHRIVKRPMVVGVTELTSLDDSDLETFGSKLSYRDSVFRKTELAKEWGLDGVTCPAGMAGELEKRFGSGLLYVTPGIELAGRHGEGQKQISTPDNFVRAAQQCTNYLLVAGSAIMKADNRYKAAYAVVKRIAKYQP